MNDRRHQTSDQSPQRRLDDMAAEADKAAERRSEAAGQVIKALSIFETSLAKFENAALERPQTM